MALKLREEMLQATIEASTPVPQSFTQSVNWAAGAALAAIEAGRKRQTMYFNTGATDNQVTGEIGGVLQFTEQLVRALITAENLPEGNGIRILFSDLGAQAMVAQRWQGDALPDGVVLDYFPPVLPKTPLKREDQMKLTLCLEASVLIVVTPGQAELPAVLALMQLMRDRGEDVPVIFINAALVRDFGAAAGVMLQDYRSLEKTLLPVFHLEQYDPPDDKDDIPLNPAVLCRVWPRPFSVWEDSPSDPESLDGYFLLDVNEVKAQSIDEVLDQLQNSRKALKKMREIEREKREKGGKLI